MGQGQLVFCLIQFCLLSIELLEYMIFSQKVLFLMFV